jgi:hypothetical protein
MKTLKDLLESINPEVELILELIKDGRSDEASVKARYTRQEVIWNILTSEIYDLNKQNIELQNQLAELVILTDQSASTESINKHQDDK